MRILIAALCALAPAVAAQAEYSWELSGLFDHTERNRVDRDFGELDSDLVSLSATHYFRPVEESSGPLALAAFLDPRTQLSVAAGEEQITDQYFFGTRTTEARVEEEVADYSLRGLYLLPESKWYAGGRYTRYDGEGRSRSVSFFTVDRVTSEDVEDYALFAGKYFGAGATRLELSLERSTTESESSSTSCHTFIPGPCSTSSFSTELTRDTPRLAVMHVRRFRSATYALLGEYSEIRGDTPRTYVVGAELYPIPTVGVRLGYERTDSRGAEVNTASIGASWFVRRKVGLELMLSRTGTDYVQASLDEPPDTDRAALRVIGRL